MIALLIACGGTWTPDDLDAAHADFAYECGHAEATCESCHAESEPLGPIDGGCLSCHEAERPDTHDAARTADCSECHSSCDWFTASPHPGGFGDGEQHGPAFNLQQFDEADPSGGDCRDCHGEQLDGGEASGCDDCHADEGLADWRTDCVLCHGGELEPSGAPPSDIDDASPISFVSHTAHVDDSTEYRATPCTDCHVDAIDVLTAGHVLDATPGVSEVVFDGGPSPLTTWSGGTCSSVYCHGPGSLDDGAASDSDPPMDCGTCHAITDDFSTMSGLHETHLDEPAILCNDCHAGVIDAAGSIVEADLHVDGTGDVALAESSIVTTDGGGTCEGDCHGYPHDGTGWGHAPGYDAPEIHGQEALFLTLDCAACHPASDCDDCHQPNWRTTCDYCHGSGPEGVPPSDLDNQANEDLISFKSHPEHDDNDEHPAYGCETCHGVATLSYVDAFTDPGHWFDSTPGQVEVAFTGIAAGATYSGGTCSSLYCHGDGRSDGSETDGVNALACTACHGMPPNSGDHGDHDHDNYPCAECHAVTVDENDTIIGPNIHVDGTSDVDMNAALNSVTWNGSSCSGSCHGEGHSNESWN